MPPMLGTFVGAAVTPDLLAAFGVEGEWRFAQRRQVLWADVDRFGHANHTTFLRYFEDARCTYVEAMGGALAMDQPGPVMSRLSVHYVKPLAYGDEALVTTRAVSIGRTSIVFDYATWKDGACCTAQAVIVFVINASGAKAAIPAAMRAAVLALDAPVQR